MSATGPSQGGLFDAQLAPLPRHRLFFALVPPDEVRQRFAETAERLREEKRVSGRWVRPARYHLTLAFLGDHVDLSESRLRPMHAAAAAVRATPFSWQVDEVITFRGRQPPCVLRSATGSVALQGLWAQLRRELARVGLDGTVGRHFEPHVTLAYTGQLLPAPLPLETPVDWHVETFELLHGDVDGRDYDTLASWRLAG